METPRQFSHTIWLNRSLILNANKAYSHWGNRSGPAKTLRQRGAVASQRFPRMARARVDVVVSYPDRKKRDVFNLYPTMKSYIDGLVDNEGGGTQSKGAGFLPDDNDIYLSGPFMHWSGMLSDRPGKNGMFRFDLLVTEMESRPIKETKDIGQFDVGQRWTILG